MRVSEIKKRRDAASAFLAPLACGAWRSARVAVGVSPGGASGRRGEEDAFAVVGAVVSVVARVARARHGVRHHCRGADADGNVANFVETEQMLEVETDRARRFQGASADAPVAGLKKKSRGEDDDDDDSRIVRRESYVSCFVITRGSAPVRWAQPLRDMRWRFPMAFLEDASASAASARASRRVRAEIRRVRGARFAEAKRVVVRVAPGRVVRRRRARGGDARASRSICRTRSRARRPRSARDAVAFDGRCAYGFWFDSTRFQWGRRRRLRFRKTHAQTGAFRVNCKVVDRTNVAAALAFRALQLQLRVNAFVGSNQRRSTTARCGPRTRDARLHAARARCAATSSAPGGAGARRAGRRASPSGGGGRAVLRRRAQDAARFFTSGGSFSGGGHAPGGRSRKKNRGGKRA